MMFTGVDTGRLRHISLILGVWLAIGMLPRQWASASTITDLRVGSKSDYVRLVLESDQPLTPAPSYVVVGTRLDITLSGIDTRLVAPHLQDVADDIAHIDVSHASGTLQIRVDLSFTPQQIKRFSLTAPHRYIIDSYRSVGPEPLAKPETTTPVSPIIAAPINEPTVPPDRVADPSDRSRPPATARLAVMPPATTDAAVSSPAIPASGDKTRMQHGLLAALTVVTAIICTLLVILMRASRRRRIRPPQAPYWTRDLPLTRDKQIESLDAAIHKQLKSYDRLRNRK